MCTNLCLSTYYGKIRVGERVIGSLWFGENDKIERVED